MENITYYLLLVESDEGYMAYLSHPRMRIDELFEWYYFGLKLQENKWNI